MNIFVDIGSHIGQTIEEVVKPRWAFDEIHAIEPMPREVRILRTRFGHHPQLRFHPYALWDRSGATVLWGSNDLLEASIWRQKDDVNFGFRTEVDCMDASAFFGALDPEASVTVNMNCEGAEVPILDDLLTSGEIKRITHLLVDFDIRKVPGQEQHEFRLREALDAAHVSYTAALPERETHQEQIAAWLEAVL